MSWQNECQDAIQLVGVNADENFQLANSFRYVSIPWAVSVP